MLSSELALPSKRLSLPRVLSVVYVSERLFKGSKSGSFQIGRAHV